MTIEHPDRGPRSTLNARRLTSLALTIVAAIAVAGCKLGMDVDCGSLAASDCEAATRRAVTLAGEQKPGTEIVRIEFTTPDGGYHIEFADGTMVGVQG